MALSDWVSRVADRVERERGSNTTFTVAAGVSPSGPVHMGNLREVMTAHLVADELERRGRSVRFLLFWDDYDRFRKIPVGVSGVDDSWSEFLGRPLSEIPSPAGSTAGSWAEHFMVEFRTALHELGVVPVEVRQSVRYREGFYVDSCAAALDARIEIGEVLASRQTLGTPMDPAGFYPFRAYCEACGRDTTAGTGWSPVGRVFSYACECGYSASAPLSEVSGKLVWKVDWPMRWVLEHVDFEPCGVDHMSPGSSWDVGGDIAPLLGGSRPVGQGYSFVGFDGAAKMASSAGGAPTPGSLLPILGAHVMRWLYVRARPEQSFSLDLTAVPRLMDQWDALTRKVAAGKGKDGDVAAVTRSTSVAVGGVPMADDATVRFASWASFADMTRGDIGAMLSLAESSAAGSVSRAVRASSWVETFVPADERIVFRGEPDTELLESLSPELDTAVEMLRVGLREHSGSADELTAWVFGVPKLMFGLSVDERDLAPEVWEFQGEFFSVLYRLLIGRHAGPRIPLLVTCVGVDESVRLLGE